jgi:hypothetical protein
MVKPTSKEKTRKSPNSKRNQRLKLLSLNQARRQSQPQLLLTPSPRRFQFQSWPST